MVLKLLTEWQANGADYAPGTLVTISDEAVSKSLIDAGIAEAYDAKADAEAKAKAAADATSQEEAARKEVKRIVDEELAKAKAASDGIKHITVKSEPIDRDKTGGFDHFATFLKTVRDASAGRWPEKLQKWADFQSKAAGDGHRSDVDTAGGFLVPEQFSGEVLKKMEAEAVIAPRCTRIPMSSSSIVIPFINETSRADGSRQGGIRAYWEGEGVDHTKSDTKFGRLRLELKKVAAIVYATDELLEDSAVSVEALINQLVGEELAFALDNAIINGNGVGMPLGILKSPALVTINEETSQADDTIVTANISKMWARMPARNRARAVWLANQDIEPELDNLHTGGTTATSGAYTHWPVMLPGGSIAAAPNGMLKGREIIMTEFNPTLGDVGDIIFADLSQYLLGMKSDGVKATSSIHVRFTSDETAFKFTMRADGQPWWNSAITPFKSAATISPFVVIEAR